MSNAVSIKATKRTELGKGPARRARVAGLVPAVVYGHGEDPRHITISAGEFSKILRQNGVNALLDLDIEGESQLALVKQVVVHPIKRKLEHADLLIVRRGEKVEVEVAVHVVGEAASGTQVLVDATTIVIEADVLNIPEQIEANVADLEVGSQILASDLVLPEGSSLVTDADQLVVNVAEVQAADVETDTTTEDPESVDGDAAAESAEEASE